VFRVGSTAMVVKRITRNKGNTRHTCRTACAAFAQVCPVVSRSNPLDGWATTLNVACSWTAPITTVSHSSSSVSSNQSHRSCSQSPHSLRPNPAEGEGLASHSCEAGLSQGHPLIARYHTTTCQQLPTPQRESLHHAAQTPFDGLGLHTSLVGWMIYL
jgi:hypothetical protein